MSLIDESGALRAHGASRHVGSHHVNGVARLHSELAQANRAARLRRTVAGKFCNVTNGVTPRRFVAVSNPRSRS
jgi:glycogen phosphorylase